MGKTFLSVDVETTGPTPGSHSLLSIGFCPVRVGSSGKYEVERDLAIGFNILRRDISDSLQSVLAPAPDFHRDTYIWWLTQETAWKASRQNLITCFEACERIKSYFKSNGLEKATLAAWPSSFDIPWFNWLMAQSDTHSLLGHSAFCIGSAYKTLKEIKGKLPFKIPKKPKLEGLQGHTAKDDAIEQAYAISSLFNLLESK